MCSNYNRISDLRENLPSSISARAHHRNGSQSSSITFETDNYACTLELFSLSESESGSVFFSSLPRSHSATWYGCSMSSGIEFSALFLSFHLTVRSGKGRPVSQSRRRWFSTYRHIRTQAAARSRVCGYKEALKREKFKDRKKDRPKSSSTGQQESQFSAENLSPTRSTLANIIIVLKLPSDAFILFCSFSISLAVLSICPPRILFFFAYEVLLHFLVQHSRPRRGIYSGPVAP